MAKHVESGLGRGRYVNVWMRNQSPTWKLSFDMANVDLPFFISLMQMKNWKINLRLICIVNDPAYLEEAKHYLSDLFVLARMPKGYKMIVEHAKFEDYLETAPTPI
jgi:hypothetical protein